MAERINLTASQRSGIGSSQSRKLRYQGRIPAILYGAGKPQTLELSSVSLIEALQEASSENVLVNLSIEGEGSKAKAHLALIQEIQHHPIKDTVLHVDFHEVRQDQKIQANVPIIEEGVPDGVKNGGGRLEHLIRELHIECLPKDLPSTINVDVSGVGLEQSIHIGDLTLPDGVVATQDKDLTVFMVHPPRVKSDDDAGGDAGKSADAGAESAS
ncbi:MAG: 50S ribosomal protein L25 [Verrucomicrobiota bacterium]